MSASATNSAANTRDERATAPATLAWQDTARHLVITHTTISPIVAARMYALLGVGQYGAAVAADRALGITGSDDASVISSDEGGRAQYEARRGAIGGASRVILSSLFSSDAAAVAAMQRQLAAEAIGPNGRTHPWFTRGVQIGEAMGEVMKTWASNDGFSTAWTNPPFAPWLPGTPGQWYQASATAAPAGFQFPGMKPYFLTKADQFRPPPPPAYLSPEFNAGLKVVRDIADTRTSAQTASALFWNLNTGTVTALGYWDQRAAESIVEHGLGDRAAAHVLALTNAAALDATIGCWDAKYKYVLVRPVQADPLITMSYPLPNHPSYPSGHSCVSAAAAAVLSAFFPERQTELDAGVAAAGMSRIFGGIHYPFDVSAGQALGRSAAAWALNYDRTKGLLTAVGQD
jgi:membrane-associated phospholipid phosphatase